MSLLLSTLCYEIGPLCVVGYVFLCRLFCVFTVDCLSLNLLCDLYRWPSLKVSYVYITASYSVGFNVALTVFVLCIQGHNLCLMGKYNRMNVCLLVIVFSLIKQSIGI